MGRAEWEAFVVELEAAGYFKYTQPELLDEVKSAIIESESLFGVDSAWDATGRVFWGDAERLAEGGVLSFLFQVSPFLQGQGVVVPVYLDQDFAAGRWAYSVTVNLDEHVMLAEEEQGEVMAWVAVPARAFGLVNKMLEKAGSPERVYTTMGSIAQQSLAIFLTPDLYSLMKNSPLLANEENQLLTVEELGRLW